MKLHYWQSKNGVRNFGDEINPWLWPRLFPGAFDDDATTLFVGIGTLLNDRLPASPRTIVFGSGVGYFGPPRGVENWHILRVRGPLSAEALGIDPARAITDPALLARRFVPPDRRPLDVAYMPHWSNAGADWEHACRRVGLRYLDPRWPVEEVVAGVLASRMVIAEAMHGAIMADAPRVPWIPVVTRRGILEFKWRDWCASVGLEYRPIRLPALWPETGPSSVRSRIGRSIKSFLIRIRPQRLTRAASSILGEDSIAARLEARLDDKVEKFRKSLAHSS